MFTYVIYLSLRLAGRGKLWKEAIYVTPNPTQLWM